MTDIQIEGFEKSLSDALLTNGFLRDVSFQIHIDGWLDVTLSVLDYADAAKIKPYIEPISLHLSAAYASESRNRAYYMQALTRILNSEDADQYTKTARGFEQIRSYRQMIREYMFANGMESSDEIMAITRNIHFENGRLIFEEK